MKPQKQICKRCVEKQTSNGWGELDELAWDKMSLHFCSEYAKERNNIVSVEKKIPPNCIFLLEYLMYYQGKKNEA